MAGKMNINDLKLLVDAQAAEADTYGEGGFRVPPGFWAAQARLVKADLISMNPNDSRKIVVTEIGSHLIDSFLEDMNEFAD